MWAPDWDKVAKTLFAPVGYRNPTIQTVAAISPITPSSLGIYLTCLVDLNLLKPIGYVMNQQFNIQQLYTLPTLYLCVLYLYENKQRLVSLAA